MTMAYFKSAIFCCRLLVYTHTTMNKQDIIVLMPRKRLHPLPIAVISTKQLECHAGLLPLHKSRVYKAPAPWWRDLELAMREYNPIDPCTSMHTQDYEVGHGRVHDRVDIFSIHIFHHINLSCRPESDSRIPLRSFIYSFILQLHK